MTHCINICYFVYVIKAFLCVCVYNIKKNVVDKDQNRVERTVSIIRRLIIRSKRMNLPHDETASSLRPVGRLKG